MYGTVIQFVLFLIAHAAAGIYSSTPKYSKKVMYTVWGIWVAQQTALLFITEFVLTNEIVQFFVGFVFALIGQYVIFFVTTKGRLTQRIFTILTYSVFFCIVISVFTMVDGTFDGLSWVMTALIQFVLLSAIVFYYLRYVCPLCRKASKKITNGWAPLILVDGVFLITVILSAVFPTRITRFDDPAFPTFLFLSVSIMAVYPVIFSNINNMSEAAMKKEVEMQNKVLLSQIEAENAQLTAESQARHDRRHHNLVMLEYAKNNDIEGVREYLSQLVESESTECTETKYCDNMIVNTVMTVYGRKAREYDIPVNISADVSRNVNVSAQDLVIVIANLFENAVNATRKLKNNDKAISVSVKERAQRLLIRIENPCKEKMVFDESSYGIGLRSVISTVNGYDGMFDFSADSGIFSAKISLNLK